MKILMVCLGNICRSPMAQGILQHKAKKNSLEIEVDSAGTASYHIGDPPDSRSVAKSQEYGIDIKDLRGRQFRSSDFDSFDQIFVMDNNNLQDVLALARHDQDKKKVSLILNKIFPGQNMAVPDPYYGGEDGFENVYRLLDQACDKIVSELSYEQ